MKNLINIKDFDKLNDLPSKITGRKLSKITNSWENYKMKNTHDTNGISVYDRAERIIEAFVNKPANDAFSHFVKQVPKYQQFVFWNILDSSYPRRSSLNYTHYYSDDNGIIRFHNGTKRTVYTIQSKDYQTELRHKITGHKKTDFEEIFEQFKKVVKYGDKKQYESIYTINGDFLYYEYGAKKWREKPAHCRYIAYDSDFIPVIIQGYYKTFESDKDPRYVRHYAEKAKQIKKEHKLWKKKNKEESLEKLRLMYEKEKERREKEKQENLLKIIKHGFDPITSFRNEKQTNPDLIQLKQ